jgi:hypothetical protein
VVGSAQGQDKKEAKRKPCCYGNTQVEVRVSFGVAPFTLLWWGATVSVAKRGRRKQAGGRNFESISTARLY